MYRIYTCIRCVVQLHLENESRKELLCLQSLQFLLENGVGKSCGARAEPQDELLEMQDLRRVEEILGG